MSRPAARRRATPMAGAAASERLTPQTIMRGDYASPPAEGRRAGRAAEDPPPDGGDGIASPGATPGGLRREADRRLLRRHLEHPGPGVADERRQGRARPGRPGLVGCPAEGLLQRRARHEPRRAAAGRGLRVRAVEARPRVLPVPRRELRAGRRALLLRLQPRRVHRAQHRRDGPQQRDPAARAREPAGRRLRDLPRTRPDVPPARHPGDPLPALLLPRAAHPLHRRLGHGRRPGDPGARARLGQRAQSPLGVPRHGPEHDGRPRVPGARDRRDPRAVRAEPLEPSGRGARPGARAGLVRGRPLRRRRRVRRLRARGDPPALARSTERPAPGWSSGRAISPAAGPTTPAPPRTSAPPGATSPRAPAGSRTTRAGGSTGGCARTGAARAASGPPAGRRSPTARRSPPARATASTSTDTGRSGCGRSSTGAGRSGTSGRPPASRTSRRGSGGCHCASSPGRPSG